MPQIVENDSLSIPPMLFYNKTISKEGTVLELYNKRMIQILELLTQNRKVLSSDQIALSIGVSSRTIRNDITASFMLMVQPFFPKQAVDII